MMGKAKWRPPYLCLFLVKIVNIKQHQMLGMTGSVVILKDAEDLSGASCPIFI